MAGSGINIVLIGTNTILIGSLVIWTMIYVLIHFIPGMADTSTLAPYATPALKATIGPLPPTFLAALTAWASIRPMSTRPAATLATTVSPSVVLLNNHTTTRIGRKM